MKEQQLVSASDWCAYICEFLCWCITLLQCMENPLFWFVVSPVLWFQVYRLLSDIHRTGRVLARSYCGHAQPGEIMCQYWWQGISNSVFLLASAPTYPPTFLITCLTCTYVCVCFNGYIFVCFVKRGMLTHVDEMWCYRNESCYYYCLFCGGKSGLVCLWTKLWVADIRVFCQQTEFQQLNRSRDHSREEKCTKLYLSTF